MRGALIAVLSSILGLEVLLLTLNCLLTNRSYTLLDMNIDITVLTMNSNFFFSKKFNSALFVQHQITISNLKALLHCGG